MGAGERWLAARAWGGGSGAFSLRKFNHTPGTGERNRIGMAWAGLCAILLHAGLRRELGLSIASVSLASLHLWCQGPLHMHTLGESEVQNISFEAKAAPCIRSRPRTQGSGRERAACKHCRKNGSFTAWIFRVILPLCISLSVSAHLRSTRGTALCQRYTPGLPDSEAPPRGKVFRSHEAHGS